MSGAGDFWSRRKARVAAEEAAEIEAVEAAQVAEEQKALEERSDEEILAALELPDPDTLGEGDDFSVFMAKAVPDRIRRRALRRLWLANPVFRQVDALVEYGEDYTDAANVVENLQTTYQVGKGMLKHLEALAAQAEEKASDEADEAEDAPVEDTAPVEEEEAPVVAFAEPELVQPEPEAEPAPRARRHMRFSFDSDRAEGAA